MRGDLPPAASCSKFFQWLDDRVCPGRIGYDMGVDLERDRDATKRENGENPLRSRRCNRGRTPHRPLRATCSWEGVASRLIREPEDLPMVSVAKSPPRSRCGRDDESAMASAEGESLSHRPFPLVGPDRLINSTYPRI